MKPCNIHAHGIQVGGADAHEGDDRDAREPQRRTRAASGRPPPLRSPPRRHRLAPPPRPMRAGPSIRHRTTAPLHHHTTPPSHHSTTPLSQLPTTPPPHHQLLTTPPLHNSATHNLTIPPPQLPTTPTNPPHQHCGIIPSSDAPSRRHVATPPPHRPHRPHYLTTLPHYHLSSPPTPPPHHISTSSLVQHAELSHRWHALGARVPSPVVVGRVRAVPTHTVHAATVRQCTVLWQHRCTAWWGGPQACLAFILVRRRWENVCARSVPSLTLVGHVSLKGGARAQRRAKSRCHSPRSALHFSSICLNMYELYWI